MSDPVQRHGTQCSYNESGVLGPVTVHVDTIVHRDPARVGEVDAGQATAGHTHQLHLVGTHMHTGEGENTRNRGTGVCVCVSASV